MFHFFGTVTNDRGDSLVGWQVEVVNVSDGETVIDIFADENSTPIVSVSGVANRAVADDEGNYDFYIPSGDYSVRFYDKSGEFQRFQRNLSMYGADSAGNAASLASNDEGLGASLVGFESSGTVQDALEARPASSVLAGASGSSLLGFLQAGTGATARTAQDKLREVVSAADFGATGDGATDDLAALQAAVTAAAAASKPLSIGPGTFLLSDELSLPDNSHVVGAGQSETTLKLADSVSDLNKHVVKNSANTGSYLTNTTGNSNIKIENMTIDGNGRRTGTGDQGCAVQFSFVEGLTLRNITAMNGALHCIDIAPAQTFEGYEESGATNETYTSGPCTNVLLENCVGIDPVNDDAITLHYAINATLINPVATWTGTYTIGNTQQGVEIDDGCRSVAVLGGSATDFVVGLQIKGHDYAPAAREVTVINFTATGCGENFDIEHSDLVSTTGRNVTLIGCKSVEPEPRGSLTEARFLHIRAYEGVQIQGFTCEGDASNTTDNTAGVVLVSENARKVQIDGLYLKNVNRPDGAVRVTSTAGENIRITRVSADECYDLVGRFTCATHGIVAEDWYAELSVTSSPVAGVIEASAGVANNEATRIGRITANAGYTNAIVDGDGSSSASVALGNETIGAVNRWIRANSSGGTPGAAQVVSSIGYLGGNQNLGLGESILQAFKFRVQGGTEYVGGFIGMEKASATDSDTSHDVVIGTRDNGDGGTGASVRLRITHDSHVVVEDGLTSAANDTAAASAGVPVNGLYRNGSDVLVRVS